MIDPVADDPRVPADPSVPGHTRRRLGNHPLLRYTARRLAIGVVLVVVVSILVFVATEVLPGNAARASLGPKASEAQVAVVSKELGLDRPLPARYLSWLGNVVQGNLGTSFAAGGQAFGAGGAPTQNGVDVATLISGPMKNSAILAGLAVLILFPLSIVLGTIAGTHAGRRIDHFVSLSTIAGLALPDFVIATLLIYAIAIGTGLLPPVSIVAPGANPLATPSILVLPVAALVIITIGATTRQVRAGVITAAESEYTEMARLNGIAERRVVDRWILRNAMAPSVQIFAQTLQYLLGGVVLVEYVFSYPGIGAGFVSFVTSRDVPSIQAVAVIIATLYIALNVFADVIVVALVPKARTAA